MDNVITTDRVVGIIKEAQKLWAEQDKNFDIDELLVCYSEGCCLLPTLDDEGKVIPIIVISDDPDIHMDTFVGDNWLAIKEQVEPK